MPTKNYQLLASCCKMINNSEASKDLELRMSNYAQRTLAKQLLNHVESAKYTIYSFMLENSRLIIPIEFYAEERNLIGSMWVAVIPDLILTATNEFEYSLGFMPKNKEGLQLKIVAWLFREQDYQQWQSL